MSGRNNAVHKQRRVGKKVATLCTVLKSVVVAELNRTEQKCLQVYHDGSDGFFRKLKVQQKIKCYIVIFKL